MTLEVESVGLYRALVLAALVGPHSGEPLGRLRRLGFWGVLLCAAGSQRALR